jgi:hypothetical protein
LADEEPLAWPEPEPEPEPLAAPEPLAPSAGLACGSVRLVGRPPFEAVEPNPEVGLGTGVSDAGAAGFDTARPPGDVAASVGEMAAGAEAAGTAEEGDSVDTEGDGVGTAGSVEGEAGVVGSPPARSSASTLARPPSAITGALPVLRLSVAAGRCSVCPLTLCDPLTGR